MNFRRHSLRRWFLITIVTMACLIALTLVLLSPLALAWLKNLNRNWLQLSNMGQTYGAISALISSLALGGVVVSLIYQARDLRTTRNQGIRSFQHHLIEMEM